MMMPRAAGRGGHVRFGGPGRILRRDQRRFLSYPYTRKAIRPDDGRGDRDKDRDLNGDYVVRADLLSPKRETIVIVDG